MSDCRVRASMCARRTICWSDCQQDAADWRYTNDACKRRPEPYGNKLACVSSLWRFDILHNPIHVEVSM
jgi:hypothetical protein